MRHIRIIILFSVFLAACSEPDVIAPERYVETDKLISKIRKNISQNPALTLVADIDHSRLAQEAKSSMGPARVILFSDITLETALIQLNPLAALDLPLRILAYESPEDNTSNLTYNSFDYLSSRFQLSGQNAQSLGARYTENMSKALTGIPAHSLIHFKNNHMQPDGIITLTSPFNFDETLKAIYEAIDSQDDTLRFGAVDFQQNARALSINILPSYMILFGGPAPGGKAMAEAPTLGLDAFCQKFLVWQDEQGLTHLSFNDLLAIADRQQTPKAMALRIIDYRLTKVFRDALAPN